MAITVLQLDRECGKTIFANNIDELNSKVACIPLQDGERLKMSKIKFKIDANNHIRIL